MRCVKEGTTRQVSDKGVIHLGSEYAGKNRNRGRGLSKSVQGGLYFLKYGGEPYESKSMTARWMTVFHRASAESPCHFGTLLFQVSYRVSL